MDYYHVNFREYFERTATIDPAPFLLPLTERLAPPARVLDVGCGSGRDLAWLKARGYRPTGFERSPGLAGLARRHSGRAVIEGDFDTFDFSILRADAILLVGSLIHLPHDAAIRALGRIAGALNDGGLALISIKEGETAFTDRLGRPCHPWREATMRGRLEEMGFTILEYFRQPSALGGDDMWLGYVCRLNRPWAESDQAITRLKRSEQRLISSEAMLKRSRRELEFRNRIAQAFLISPEESAYGDVLRVALAAVESPFGVLGYVDDAEQNMVAASITDEVWWDSCRMTDRKIIYPRAEWRGTWGKALLERRTVIVNQPGRVPEGHLPIARVMSTPILYGQKRLGILTAANKPTDYNATDGAIFENIAADIAPVLRVRLQKDQEAARRRKAETQLLQSQKREAIGTLAGGIAHDFNNILFPIVGYSEMSLQEANLPPLIRKNIEQILSSALRARDLVKQILTFSRHQEMERAPVTIHPIVKEALRMLRAAIPTNIAIVNQIAPVGPILADVTQIHQIVVNLCTNAYHAMREDGGTLQVKVREVDIHPTDTGYPENGTSGRTGACFAGHPIRSGAGRHALLTVSDTGRGMDAETLHRIFEPYFTTKKPGEGTGLGLAVVEGIVKEHGGFIMVESRPGAGSVFKVHFPLIDCQAPMTEEIQAPPWRGDGEKILVVDDEPFIIELLTGMLESLGYSVVSRPDAHAALACFRAHHADLDLVLTDMTMPGMTGDRLLTEIKAIRPDMPVLLCSGFSDRIDAHGAKTLGAAGFLMKPVVRSQMAESIHGALNPK